MIFTEGVTGGCGLSGQTLGDVDYTSLKEKLISKVKLESQHPTKSWWDWDKPGQETWLKTLKSLYISLKTRETETTTEITTKTD